MGRFIDNFIKPMFASTGIGKLFGVGQSSPAPTTSTPTTGSTSAPGDIGAPTEQQSLLSMMRQLLQFQLISNMFNGGESSPFSMFRTMALLQMLRNLGPQGDIQNDAGQPSASTGTSPTTGSTSTPRPHQCGSDILC